MIKNLITPPGMVVLALGLIASNICFASSDCKNGPSLNNYERGAFISAAQSRKSDIIIEALAYPGCLPVAVDALGLIDANVQYKDFKIGYVLATVPWERILDVIDLPGLQLAYTTGEDERTAYKRFSQTALSTERPVPPPTIEIPTPRVSMTLDKDGPYFAAAEAGLTSLWREAPQADGRGVRVAVVDEGFDLLHPALLTARDESGRTIPKVADVVAQTNLEYDRNWVRFGHEFHTVGTRFTAAGREWTAPHDGQYRFGMYAKQIFMLHDEMGENAGKSLAIAVGVLWSDKDGYVWVDTDGDGSFKDQRPLRDFGATQDTDYFGDEEGSKDNRIPFGVKIDMQRQAVYLSIADRAHGGLVAGPLAANRATGGLFTGAAPSAQLIDVRMPPASILMPAVLAAFARDDVDVVSLSGIVGIPFEDGHDDFHRRVLEQAIRVYDKPIACISGAAGSLTVLEYQSPDMLRRNRQLPPPYADAIHSLVWMTPDGVVNTILAPSTSLITESRYMPAYPRSKDGRQRLGNEPLPAAPDGYAIGANPSPTIPVVSGILADLISEARREHIRYDAARLTQAVLTGAHLVPGFPTSEQGVGLVNAANAWHQLESMARSDDPENPVLTSFTITRQWNREWRTVYGFEEDVTRPKGTLDGKLWITRHGGYRARMYHLSVRGNDGTFTLVKNEILLVRDRPECVQFVARSEPGHHVAFLQVRDATTGVVMQEIPLSVRSPDQPEIIAPGREQYQTTLLPLRGKRVFVRLPLDVQAARFEMSIPYVGPPLVSHRVLPGFKYGYKGFLPTPTERPKGPDINAAHHVGPMQYFESLVANSAARTVEVQWDNCSEIEYGTPNTKPCPDIPIKATLTVDKYAVAFKTSRSDKLEVINKLASVRGHVELLHSTLRSYGVSDLTGRMGARTMLPEGLVQWRVSIAPAAAVQRHIDVFLLDCTQGDDHCTVVSQAPLHDRAARLVVDSPHSGSWRVVIRSRDPRERPALYRITEALLSPSLHNELAGDGEFRSGETRTIRLPGDSRHLYAGFRITSKHDQGSERGPCIAITALSPALP